MAISSNRPALVKDVIGICDDLRLVAARVNDTVARYFDTGVSAEVNALPNGTDMVTGTPIDKENLLAAITLMQQLQNFLSGSAVTSAVYRVTMHKVAALKTE